MLIYVTKRDVIISLENIDIFSIVSDDEDTKKFFLIVRLGLMFSLKLYESSSKKKCKDMLNSILDAYEQGVKVFRI